MRLTDSQAAQRAADRQNVMEQLLAAAKAAWNCIGELPPTQARVEVAMLLQAAIADATGG